MNKFSFCLLVFFSLIQYVSYSQRTFQIYNLAAGVRYGEPSGLSLKYFFNRSLAVDICLGQNGGVYWRRQINISGKNDTVKYVSTGVKGWAIATNFCGHRFISYKKTIYLYFGGGFQILIFGGPGTRIIATQTGKAVGEVKPFTITSVGPLAGLEYNHPDFPISIFIDSMPIIEVISDSPGTFHYGGGFGLRLSF